MHDPRVYRGRALARPPLVQGSAGRAGDPAIRTSMGGQDSTIGSSTGTEALASTARLGAAFGRTLGQQEVLKLGQSSTADHRAAAARERRKRRGPNPFKAKARPEYHESIDLSQFLVEDEQENPAIASLRAAGGLVIDQATQTDDILVPPPRPAYPAGDPACMQGVHLKRGVDADTQTDPAILWDFDEEVAPLLDVIVGKTLEQALLEVTEESQLATLHARKHELTGNNRLEAVRVREMEAKAVAAAQRGRLELRRRQRGARVSSNAAAKVCSLQVGRAIARGALAEAVRRMRLRGQFRDGLETEMRAVAVPRALEAAIRPGGPLEKRLVSRAMVDDLIRSALGRRAERCVLRVQARIVEEQGALLSRKILLTVVVARVEAARNSAPGGGEDEEAEEEANGEDGGSSNADQDDGEDDEDRDSNSESANDDTTGRKNAKPEKGLQVGPIELSRLESVGAVLGRVETWLREKLPPAESRRVLRGRILRLGHTDMRPAGSQSASDAVREAAERAGASADDAAAAAAGLDGSAFVLPAALTLEIFSPVQLRGLVLLNLPDPAFDGEDEDEDVEGADGDEEEDDED